MRATVCSLLFCLVACASSGAVAATYQLRVPCEGDYTSGDLRRFLVDFGTSFAGIQSLTMVWEGEVTPGLWSDLLWGSEPDPGGFVAVFYRNGGTISDWAKQCQTPLYGYYTFPYPEHFVVATEFESLRGYDSWDFLLDGVAFMEVCMQHTYHIAITTNETTGSYAPTGTIYSANLILNATPVPEPATALPLLCAIGACVLRGRQGLTRR